MASETGICMYCNKPIFFHGWYAVWVHDKGQALHCHKKSAFTATPKES